MAAKIEDYALIGDCETAALVAQRLHRLAVLAGFFVGSMFCRAAGNGGERILEDHSRRGRMDDDAAAIALTH